MGLNAIQDKAAAASPVNINRDFAMADRNLRGKLSELLKAGLSKNPKTIRVLDVGCGNGRALSQVVQKLKTQIEFVTGTGIDLNPIEDSRVDKTDINLLAGDAQDLSGFPASSYDIGFSVATTQYFKNPLKAFFEVNRLMRPGGVFLWNFGTSPVKSHISPIFKDIRDASLAMVPFFSIQPGLVINHVPASILPPPTTNFKMLRAAKGVDLGERVTSCRSEYWFTQYGRETPLDKLIKRYAYLPDSHAVALNRAKLKAALDAPFDRSNLNNGFDADNVGLYPFLNFTDADNSQ